MLGGWRPKFGKGGEDRSYFCPSKCSGTQMLAAGVPARNVPSLNRSHVNVFRRSISKRTLSHGSR